MPNNSGPISQLSGASERAFIREAASSPKGFTILSPVIFGSYIFLIGFVFTSEEIEGISYHVLDFSVLVSAILAFLVARGLVSSRKVNQLSLNMSTWLVSGVAGALTPAFLVWAITGVWSEELVGQIPNGLISYPTLSIILSFAISGYLISTEKLKLLKKDQEALKLKQEQLSEEIDLIRGEIRHGVDKELKSAIEVISNNELSPKLISDKLLGAIENVIRPLSHRLADLGGVSEFPPTQTSPALSPPAVLNRIQVSRVVAPELFLLGSAIFVLPVSNFFEGLPGLSFAALLTLVIFGTLVYLKAKTKNLYLYRTFAVLLVSGIAWLIGALFSAVFSGQDAYGVSLGFLTVAAVSTLAMAIISKQIQITEHLAYVNQETKSILMMLRQESWVLKNQLAKAVHGQVQAKFLAVALRLSAKEQVSTNDLDLARTDLQASLTAVAQSLLGQQLSFTDQFQTITASWEEVVEISLQADPSDIARVDGHPLARTCLIEVIGEAVSNAAKHSQSPKISIGFAVPDTGNLEVKVTSEGRLSRSDNTRSGYGSQVLNEVTSAWSLTSNNGQIILEATIQLTE
jgi:signal transduction histidine kinase